MKKIFLIPIIFYTILSSNTLKLSTDIVNNADTVLIQIDKQGIKKPKLTFEKQNIDFFNNPFKKDSYYALLPISYYQKFKKYRVIVSYIKNGKKVFKGADLRVKEGDYKSETINVKPSKFKPPKSRVKRTQQEYKEAMKIYRTVSKKILWKDDFIYPIKSKITSAFGTKRVYNGKLKSYHSGTDFRAKIGTPILASNSGIVKIAQNRFYSGNSIIIDHGQGVYTCYFHLSKMNYKVGQKVNKGDIIGLSGNTGRITGPHLHFSFRIYGKLVNPLQAIKILNTLN